MKDIAIKVEQISKLYKLYDKPVDRLKEAIGLSGKKRLYREHYALRNVSFEVERGETIGIIGVNGAGKSTILKIITGVLTPTEGKVEINGRISALLELGAGFNTDYTGLENIYLNGTMIGFSKEEIDQRLDSILEFADIGDFVNQPVKTYSSGMFVRLAFAVAINIDPEILIVDEALSVGDVFFQAKCYKKFDEFKKNGKTIIFVSHDLSSISKYCDRVILLNKGSKMAEGSANEMIDLFKKVLVNQVDEEGNDSRNEEKETETKKTDEESEWSDHFLKNPNCIEYGDKQAEIVDYGVFDDKGRLTNSILKGSVFEIAVKVRINKDIKFPIVAFTLKTLKGTEVTGTNTWFEKTEFSFNPGETKVVRFRQNMNLQGGEYLLSFGCTGFNAEEFEVYHRLYDVMNITVISDKDTVGFYDMFSEVKVD